MRPIAILTMLSLLTSQSLVHAQGTGTERDEAAYQRGYAVGMKQGDTQGQIEGARKGKEEGESRGKTEGHRDGWAAGHEKGWREGEREGEPLGNRDGEERGRVEGEQNGTRDGRQKAYNDGNQLGYQKGHAEGYEAGVNSDAAEKGKAEGTAQASRVERDRGLSEGRRAGYEERENQIRETVVREADQAAAGEATLTGGDVQNASFQVASSGNPEAVSKRNAADESNASYIQGKKDGYDVGYKMAFDRAKKASYDEAYDISYMRNREYAFQTAHQQSFAEGRQDAYNRAYQRSYQRAYDETYYYFMSRDYTEDRDRGFQEGHQKGHQDGYKKGYDETYQAAYQAAYRERAAQVYPEAFAEGQDIGRGEAQTYYDGNPVLELSEVVIQDESGDGAFSAGEKVVGKISFINYGSKDGANVTVSISSDNADAHAADAQSAGTARARRRGGADIKVASLDANIGMNVPVKFAVELKQGDRVVGQQVLKILVLNPNSTRYKFLVFGTSTVDRAMRVAQESGRQVPTELKKAKEYLKAASEVVRLDTNPEAIQTAEKAATQLDTVVRQSMLETDPVMAQVAGLAAAASNMVQNFLR